jgi:hypothetical protein
MVELIINNTEYMMDSIVRVNLRHRDQLKPGVVWDALGKVIQSNDRFDLTDQLEFDIGNIRMLAGNGVVKS